MKKNETKLGRNQFKLTQQILMSRKIISKIKKNKKNLKIHGILIPYNYLSKFSAG